MSSINYHCETPVLVSQWRTERNSCTEVFVTPLKHTHHNGHLSLNTCIDSSLWPACVCAYVLGRQCQHAIDRLQIHPPIITYRKSVTSPPLCQSSFGLDMKFITDVLLC